jgi:Tfp pilus assembly protein PilF
LGTLGEQAGSVVVVENNNYTFNGPVGAAGTNARGLLIIGGSQVDASQLAQELERLSKYLSDRDPEDSDASALAEAARDAREGNSAGADSKLRRVSRRALSAANDLALAVAGAVIAHSIGVG